MADNPFLFLGNNQPQESKRARAFREDNRVINIRRSNQIISAINGNNVVNLVDQKGKGVVRSVKVVTDNPYIEMILEIDDYRVDGIYAAELMYNGDTVKSDYEVYSTNGGNPGTGYVLNYTPMGGETFEKRFRVTLRNRIPPHVIFGYTKSYVPGNGLPIPENLGFNAGSFWSSGAQPKVANLNFDVGVFQDDSGISLPNFESAAAAFATSTTSPMYEATWPNPAIRNDPGARRGIHHPYVGIAGKPTFTVQRLIITPSNGGNMDEFHTAFFDPRLPSGDNVAQQIVIANIGDNAKAGHLHTFAAGARLFIKDNNGRFYFPGELTSVPTAGTIEIGTAATDIEAGKIYRITTAGTTNFTLIGSASNTVGAKFTATGPGTGTGTVQLAEITDTGTAIPTEYHGAVTRTGSFTQHNGVRFDVTPGMQQKQPPIAIPHNQVITAASAGGYLTTALQGHLCGDTNVGAGSIASAGNKNGAAGHVTTQAEVDPHVLLMRADVKYKLEVSYDG
jgi:hypothetical protein